MVKNNLEKKVSKDLKIYSFEEAVKESTEYFGGDIMAARNWVNKYALKDSEGKIYESNPNQMHERLAGEISRIESKYENPVQKKEIYDLIKNFDYFVPQGGPMSGMGNDNQIVSLSNCFVIGREEDSYSNIMKTDEEQVQLMKRRGGVGHDLSHIRPKGSPVLNSALTSTGVVPFMERYSNSTREVAQDGRRGALMLSLSIKHPDAESFIDAKLEQGKVTGANISVKIDDEFMEAVCNGGKYIQQYPVNSENPEVTKEIDANKLWYKIVNNAWKSAEPGILFWDNVINESIPDSYADLGFKTVSTNPCGEIPLCPYDSCRLTAMNLYSYVENPFEKNAEFNFEKFKRDVRMSQRFSDDIIDAEVEKIEGILEKISKDPESAETRRTEKKLWENIKQTAKTGRRMGMGITAEGDMLAALGLQYGSKDAIDFATEIHKTLAIEAYRGSVELAKERGAFEIYDFEREKDNPFIQRLGAEDPQLIEDMKKYGRRNIALLTIAPTGTTSQMTQTTSGIEPAFSPVYKRRRKVNPNDKDVEVTFTDEVGDSWEEYNIFHHKFVTWMEKNGHNPSKKYSDKEIEELIKKSPYNGATANDINWISKVKMQGSIQKWVDHSISCTVNLPSDASKDLVGEVYLEAWKAECKGVTVYRDGCRDGVLLTGKEKNKKIERPKSLEAEVLRFKNNDEDWIAFVGLREDGSPYEIFTGKQDEDVLAVPKKVEKGEIVREKDEDGRKHYDFHFTTSHGYPNAVVPGISHQFNPEFWNYSKLISGLLRYKMPPQEAVEIVSSLSVKEDNINTWIKGVERALRKYIPNGAESKELCPDCKENGIEQKLLYQEGCMKCSCGFSKCG